MLDRHHSRNQSENLGGSALGLQENFSIRDELLGGSGQWPFGDYGDLRNLQLGHIWIMRKDGVGGAKD